MKTLFAIFVLGLCLAGCGKEASPTMEAELKASEAENQKLRSKLATKQSAPQTKPKEPTEAEKKFLETKTKAERGDADAQFDLSGLYMEQGDNTNEVKWLKKAAAQDHNSATHNLAFAYYYGEAVEKNLQEAYNLFFKVAVKEVSASQHMVGEMLLAGEGVKRDPEEGVRWLLKAAKSNYMFDSHARLAECHSKGIGVPKNKIKSYAWYQVSVCTGLEDLPTNVTAEMKILKAEMTEQEITMAKNLAIDLLDKVKIDDALSQYEIGWMYANGDGLEQDFKEAVKWYQKAADQGHANAQFNLGVMYERGQGVEQDFKEAFKWYQKAADQGYANGQSNLGAMYYRGRGVEQNYVTTYAWWNIAATNDHQNAKNNKSVTAKKMTPAQIAEAEELVKEMIKENPKLIKKKE